MELNASDKTNLKNNPLKNEAGDWRTLHISLSESSGAVAPEYRYTLDTYIEATKHGLFIFRKETKAGESIVHTKKRISEKTYEKISSKLIKLGIEKFGIEELPKEKLLGVNYNTVEFHLGNKKTKFYYLFQDIDKSEFKTKKEIVTIMKGIKP